MDLQQTLRHVGAESLTPMQQEAYARGLHGESFVLLSPTGSGKTLAYLLPLCERCNAAADVLQSVVIVPSRELAAQSEAFFRRMKTPLRSFCCHGGRSAMDEHRKLREICPQILFATPGRLLDHLGKGNIDGKNVCMLVIDEFDKCLELGFREEMAQVAAALPHVGQIVLTSATDAADIPAFIRSVAPSAAAGFGRIDFLSQTEAVGRRIRFSVVPSPEKDKLETLARLLSAIGSGQTIVFVAHRESAERVGGYLKKAGFSAEVYHGGMEQEHRERALYKFRSGAAAVLVATDLAARGLDIPEVGAVVHYHLPLDEAAFLHRSGRTARWQALGAVYLIIGPDEAAPPYMPAETTVCDVVGQSIQPAQPAWRPLYIGRGRRDKLSKADIVGFLCKKGGLRADQVGRIDVFARHAYAAVERGCTKALLQAIAGEKIKGMKTLIEEMKR